MRRSGGGKAGVSTAFGPPGSADRAAPPAAHGASRPLHAAGPQWQHGGDHGGDEWERWRLHSCAHHHAPRAAAAATVTAAAATATAAAASSGCCASGSGHP